jgi:hypothetical protein
MGLFQLGQDEDDEDEKRSRAISALSAIAKEARGEMPPVDMDLRADPEVREQQAWAKSREDLTDLGADNSPVPHEIDPSDSMSPESFEFAARHPSQKQPNTSYMDQLKLDDQLQLDRSPEDTTPAASMMREQADKARIFEEDDKPDALRGLTGKEPPAVLEVKVEKPVVVDEGPIDALRGLTGNAPPSMPKPHTTEGTGRQFDQPRTQGPTQADDDRPELSALAVITDVLTNGGRGLAGITRNLAGQQQQYKGEQRQKMLDQQASDYKQAQIRRLDATAGVNAKDKDWQQWKDTDASQRDYEQMRLRENQLGQGDRRVNLAEDRAAQLQDPESALKRTEVTQAERKAAAGVEGRENQKHEMIGQTAGDARTLVAARTDANLDEKHLHAAETTGDAATRSASVTTARDTAHAESPTVLADEADKFAKETDKDIQTARQIDKLDRLLQGYPDGKLPGVGIYEGSGVAKGVRALSAAAGSKGAQREQEVALDVENGRSQMSDLLQRTRSGAAGPVSEKATYDLQTGSSPHATEAEFRAGIRAMREITRGSLAVHGAGKERAAARVLDAAGLSHWGVQKPADAPAKRKPFLYDDATDDGFGKWTVK